MNSTADTVIRRTSIVIPVRDDPLIFDCLRSVDEPVEIVIATNGSSEQFIEALRALPQERLVVVTVAQPGIGGAYNAGIDRATGDFILLMDSDCVFVRGAVRALAAQIGTGHFAKGRVRFSSYDRQTQLTAHAREHLEDPLRTGRVNAYSPPLLYRRDVALLLQGYHFDPRLTWREDRDFELRRRAAGLPVQFVERAIIIHKPLTIRDDLKSVNCYGRAQFHGETLNILARPSRRHELTKLARTVARLARTTRKPLLCIYAVMRRAAFEVGYHRARRIRTRQQL